MKWHIIANWGSQLITLTQTKKSPEKPGQAHYIDFVMLGGLMVV
ncbi:hypothetical protein NSMM_240018 [Nitrosomonas mobilis]|uniref:Uncharacterized protein n=1 Tax=Nitrosomonas mobilis TaxID=51642 RepID=A0A1G5SBP6_9PROT|nr:hypothetical protein NSMM_240018 [Nitrosomonas mobilis]